MRTTLDLPDDTFQKLKVLAAQRGVTLKSLLRTAVEAELRRPTSLKETRIKFPVTSSKNPGTLALTNAEIEDLLT